VIGKEIILVLFTILLGIYIQGIVKVKS
jgi:hypothetical protein